MAVTLQCPDNATLLRLFGQGGSREEMESLAQHVEQCTRCGEQIDEMLRKDELSLGLAQPVDGTDMPDSEALVNLRRRLDQLRPAAPADKTTDAIGAHSTSASGSPFPATLPMSGDDHGITFLAPPQAPDEIGRLGPYRVLKKLGAGGMGMVLLAEDALLKRKVALKVMLPAVAVNPQARERFLREARAAAAIEHAHIITIHQVGEDNGVPFLAMPLLKGESLDDRLRREKKLPINEAVRITCEMADGLAAAHAQGLIHRDIKPGNVWLEDVPVRSPAAGAPAAPAARRPFKVKVLDFGLARSLNDEVHLTHSGAIVGTPAFMAPEQARGLTVDARADLFSLGCVLYVMLTGKRPFTGDSTMALLSSLALDTPKSPREFNPAVPAVLSDFTMRLLAKKPEERPASADAALDELRGLVRAAAAAKKAAPPSPHSAATKTLIQPAASRPDARPAKAAVRPPRRRVALLVGLALLFVIGGGFAAYQLLFKTNDGTLIVKVDDDADVRFRNGELHIMDADHKVMYTLKPSERNKTLPPGKYLIEVAGVGGLKMETDKFEIIRDGKTMVHVTVAPTEKDDTTVATKPTVDDAWIKQVRTLPADKQVEAVAAKLKEFNPGFDGKMMPWIEDGDVVGASADKAADISPVRALVSLRKFSCTGTSNQQRAPLHDLSPLKDLKLTELYSGNNQVSDLSALKGMKLRILYCGCTKVSDLSPLKDMKLTDLDCQGLKVSDLSPLTGMPLRYLNCNYTLVYDLSPLKDMKLTVLKCDHTPVTDLSPLKGMPLKELSCDFEPVRDSDILRSIKTLETINGKPAADFWKDVDAAPKAAAKKDADRRAAEWVLSIGGAVNVNGKYHEDIKVAADLPRTPIRLEAIRLKDNKQVNDAGLASFKDCENLTAVDLGGTQAGDAGLACFKACKNLTHLFLQGTRVTNAGLADLKDWKKLGFLSLDWTSVGNPVLVYLKDCKNLEQIFLGDTHVNDAGLALLNCEPLTALGLNGTQVNDEGLAYLKNCKIMYFLNLKDTKVSDAGLENLKGLAALKEIDLTGSTVTAAGVKKLAAALPKCKITWDGDTIEPKP
jgi:serine/threonine protein kinase/Leucine-rich repeat (LRR) protein